MALTYSYMGIYYTHGSSGNNFGRIQRHRGTAAARHPELHCAAGAHGKRDRGCTGNGTAIGLQALEGTARCGRGTSATGRTPDVIPGKRRGDPAAARVDQQV